MAAFKDMTGQRFGYLTVLNRGRSKPGGGAYWLCRCDCGAEKEIDGYALRKEITVSCGRACPVKKNPVEIAERFWNRVDLNGPDGCWIYHWYGTPNGYGHFWNGYRNVFAHRWAYIVLVGEIPEGLEIDHLCHVRNCVNPDHMELVTREQNMSRRIVKTHCKQGHPFSEENTYVRVNRDGRTERSCRACSSIRLERNRLNQTKVI